LTRLLRTMGRKTLVLTSRRERGLRDVRPVRLECGVLQHAEGSAWIRCGNTWVLCSATVEPGGAPSFAKDRGLGWVTAEYDMLPRSCPVRLPRGVTGSAGRRKAEIARLIGRSLRAVCRLDRICDHLVVVDCDVLQADGGTRMAAVTAGFCALALACQWMIDQGLAAQMPLRGYVAGVSVGVVDGQLVVDLDSGEDARAAVDLNVVMTDGGELVEIQATGERGPFDFDLLRRLVEVARPAVDRLIWHQKQALGKMGVKLPDA